MKVDTVYGQPETKEEPELQRKRNTVTVALAIYPTNGLELHSEIIGGINTEI